MPRFAGMAGVGRRDGTAELTCGIAPRPPGRPVCGKRGTDARQLCIIVLIHGGGRRVMNADADASQLLEQAALPRRGPLLDDAAEYLRRTRLGRRCGLIGGLVLGLGPLAGDTELDLALPRMFAGYVLGLLVSEMLAPRRD